MKNGKTGEKRGGKEHSIAFPMTERRRKPAIVESTGVVTVSPVSVVVPTYREEKNIAALTRRVFAATREAKIPIELVIIDDDSGCAL